VSAEAEIAVLQVSDTGIGIPAAAIPLVFERFYRADETRSRESGGIGLGLAIVKSICTAHRGTVSLSSAEGRGTTLRVELPLLHGWNEVRGTEEVVAGVHCIPSKHLPKTDYVPKRRIPPLASDNIFRLVTAEQIHLTSASRN
jgi:hypothetical protein